ncbi:MAG: biopolymer transporter ExbD [Terriglobales bacterium]
MGFSTAGGGPSSTGPKMNVTPLIDVLLVLIIVFMVVVASERPTGLEAQIPQPPNPKDHTIPPPDRTIVIRIHHAKPGIDRSKAEHPQVLVNEEAVEWDHLRERLRDIFAIRVERIAYVEADDDIDFQDVADVIAIARIAGVDRVGLLTEDGKHLPVTGRMTLNRLCGDGASPRPSGA